jgi:hypothetical protein
MGEEAREECVGSSCESVDGEGPAEGSGEREDPFAKTRAADRADDVSSFVTRQVVDAFVDERLPWGMWM